MLPIFVLSIAIFLICFCSYLSSPLWCLQCWGGDVEWLSPAVLPTIQEESHAATLSKRDPYPGLGAQSDCGCGGHWTLWCTLHSGKIVFGKKKKEMTTIQTSFWYSDMCTDGLFFTVWISVYSCFSHRFECDSETFSVFCSYKHSVSADISIGLGRTKEIKSLVTTKQLLTQHFSFPSNNPGSFSSSLPWRTW